MPRKAFLCFILLAASFGGFAQNDTQQNIPQVFEKASPQEEITRLEDKKFKLNIRLNQLIQEDAFGNAEEIIRIEGMIKYVDAKIAKQQKILTSEEHASKLGLPQKGALSESDYRSKKLEFHNKTEEKEPMVIKTTLTRYEFEKLPKERQERILNMPERYTIID